VSETVTSGLSVLKTRLPYVDRRALSEAWFSALHLADVEREAAAPALRGAASGVAAPSAAGRTNPKNLRANFGYPPAGAMRRYVAAVRSGGSPVGPESGALRRPVRAALAPAVARRSDPEHRTSLTVGVGGSRVQLMLRREGAVLHVVALCRPEVAAAVSRALARADAHLRLAGESVRASVRTYAAPAAPANDAQVPA